MIENLTLEQLNTIQHGVHAIAGAILIVTLIYLVIGLIAPKRFGHEKRLPVVGRTVGLIVLVFALSGGVIFFTHSHPNGPHSFKTYIFDYLKKECLAGKDLPACDTFRTKQPPIQRD